MLKRRSVGLVAVFALALAGCESGGGSGGGGSGGGGSNLPPPVAGTASTAGCTGTYTGSDPMEIYQWYLTNGGQENDQAFASGTAAAGKDIGFGSTLETGCGVKVAVVDEGLEIAHEDLSPNVVPGASVDFTTSPLSNDPTNPSAYGDHGTSVAGLIAMRGGNGIGGRGVAAEASIVGYNFLQKATTANELISLGGASYTSDTFIFNQSYGLVNTSPLRIDQVNPDAEAQYRYGVTNLRGGKGAIYVKSAGNGFETSFNPSANCRSDLTCQNANMDPYNALPYQIVVGAVNADGVKSSYSTAGSAIWVSAPGGEYGANTNTVSCPTCGPEVWKPAMLTTDQSGCNRGYSVNFFDVTNRLTVNQFILGNEGGNTFCNYTTGFNGTSSAAPVVSGVVALLLQVNPDLTWRDVKYILAKTATNDSDDSAMTTNPVTVNYYTAEPGWQETGETGVKFHNWYGFGRVNVTKALQLANPANPITYSLLPPLKDTDFPANQDVNMVIPDNDITGVTDTINVSSSGIDFIEAVLIRVNIVHPNPGDLQIELSKDLTRKSVLLNPYSAFGENGFNNDNIVLLTNLFFGDTGDGDWTIKVLDHVQGNTGTFTSWSIRILGH